MKTKMRTKKELQKKHDELSEKLYRYMEGADDEFGSHSEAAYWQGYNAGLEWALGEDKT